MLPPNVVSPGYFAVMECVPTVSDEVTNVATPEVVLPVPMRVLPSKNARVSPFGRVPEEACTVAVNVTGLPTEEGDPEDLSVVDVGTFELTVSVNGVALLASKLESPE